jgi:hypothetical protein
MPVTTSLSDSTGQVGASGGLGMVTVLGWNDAIPGIGVVPPGSISTSRGDRGYNGTVCEDDNCFINYRGGSEGDDWNQPTQYGAVKQSLRESRRGPAQKPWEINETGTVQVEMGGGKQLKIKLNPRDTGYAVAKAKLYYHQSGNWKHPPNMFDPFWKAKLHPFKRDELTNVLIYAGDMDGAAVVGTAPVEGKDQ